MKQATLVMAIFTVAAMAAPAWSSEGHEGGHDTVRDTEGMHCNLDEHGGSVPDDCAAHMEDQMGEEIHGDGQDMHTGGHHGEHATDGQSDHHDGEHGAASSEQD